VSNIAKKKLLSFIFKKALPFVGLAIFVYLIVAIGIGKVASTFLLISPIYVIIVAILTLPRMFIRNVAWQSILKQQKMNLSFSSSLKILLIGYFYATLTPGYIGHLMRIPYLKEKLNEPFGKLFVNTFIEVIVRTISIYGLILLGSLMIISYEPIIFYVSLLFIIVILAIYWFFTKENRGKRFFFIIVRCMVPKRHTSTATWVVNSFYKDFPKIKTLFYPFVLGVLTWIIIFSQIYIIALSLGINVPYHLFLVVYPIANVISFIPITSSGFGTREAAVVFLLGLLNVPSEKALVLSLVGFIITDFLTGLYGFTLALSEMRNKKIKNARDELKKLVY